MADGLSGPVADSITFTPQGNLIATRVGAPLASELDGYATTNFPVPDENAGRICESPGGQRWAMVPDGLQELKNGGWLLHPVPEIKAAFQSGSRRLGKAPLFIPVRQGCVLFLLPEGLTEFLDDKPGMGRTLSIHSAAQARIGDFTGMAVTHDESLWVSGTRGLAKINGPLRNVAPDGNWQECLPPESLPLCNFSRPMSDNEGGVTLIAELTASHQKVAVTFDGQNWAARPAGPRNLFCAWREPDQTIWAAAPNALFQWAPARTNWIEREEISAGQISDVEVEPGGAFWLATSEGLFRGALPAWSKPEPVRDLDAAVDALVLDGDNRLCFAAGNKLHMLKNGLDREYSLPAAMQGGPTTEILFPLKDGSILAGRGNALFQFKATDSSFHPVRDLAPGIKPLGRLPDGSVCLYHSGEPPFFDDFDGSQFHALPNPPPVGRNEDTPATLFIARNGDLWIAGGRATFLCHSGQWRRFASEDHGTPEAVVGFAERPDGKIWCATTAGLWEFDGKTWSVIQTRFNHINALMQCHDGGLWLASNGGLFRFCGDVWMENGEEEGLPNGAVHAICEDQQGNIWAGNAHGLTVFHPEADTSPPRTYVRWLGGKNHRLSEGDSLNLSFEGMDKWKITPQNRLLYSYQLDQHGWSPFQDLTMFTFPDAAPGRHYFQVRAMDRNGNVDPASASLDFTVAIPWFREVRLWIALLLGLAAAVFFAALAWNRHQQLLRSHAAVEQKVAERTRELEIATRELLHSQKMNALGTLAAGIAHDFNNILSIIKGSAQIIEDNTDHPDKIRTRVSRIKTVVQQGAEIVDAMLGFGREAEAVAAPCDINHVVSDTVKLLGDRFLHEVEVKLERAEKLPEVAKPREFIQQILLNFIFNAAEAMTSQKKLTLITRLTDKLPADIFLAPASAASFVLVSVQDEGSGIAPEIKSRIFEPFFTTKALSTRRGTGLGLSMVYELAKKMGAGLAVHSIVGQGSTFTLILPVQGEPAANNRAQIPVEPLHS